MASVTTTTGTDYRVRVAMVGESAVGKTSILLKFVEDCFFDDVPVVTQSRDKSIPVENRRCRIEVNDTAGQEQFRVNTESHFRGADCILLVFDVTNPDSLVKLETWWEECEPYARKGCYLQLMANKVDLQSERKVTPEQIESFAKPRGCVYFECSAKTGKNITEAFRHLAREVGNTKAPPPEKKAVDTAGSRQGRKGTCLVV